MSQINKHLCGAWAQCRRVAHMLHWESLESLRLKARHIIHFHDSPSLKPSPPTITHPMDGVPHTVLIRIIFVSESERLTSNTAGLNTRCR